MACKSIVLVVFMMAAASSMVHADGNDTWIVGLQDTTGSTLLAQYWDTVANVFDRGVVIPAPPATFWHQPGPVEQGFSGFQFLWQACHQCVRGGSCRAEQSGSCEWYLIRYAWEAERITVDASQNCSSFTPLAFGWNHNTFTEGYVTAQCDASSPSSIKLAWLNAAIPYFRVDYAAAAAGIWSADYSKAIQWPIDITVAAPVALTFDSKGMHPVSQLTLTKFPADALSIITVINTDSPDAFIVATTVKGADTSARWGWVQRVSSSEFQYVNGNPQRLSFISNRQPDAAFYDSVTKLIVASSTVPANYVYRIDAVTGIEVSSHVIDQRVPIIVRQSI